jgi:AraC-like DNA-binding protein
MDAPPPDFGVMYFKTDAFAPSVRLDAWRRMLSKKLFDANVESIPSGPFATDVRLRILPEIRVGTGRITANVSQHDRTRAKADNDDILMLVNADSAFVVSQRKSEVTLGPGDGALIDCAEEGRFVRATDGNLFAIRFRRALLDGIVHLDDAIGRVIDGSEGKLQMLTNYAAMLCDPEVPLGTPELRQSVTQHLADLAMLSVGATKDCSAIARRRGMRAAKLFAIKKDVLEFLSDGGLNVGRIATRHGITPRHVHRLFEEDSTTFSAFILASRLTRAHDMLKDMRGDRLTIAAIAYRCGFNDIPHFNRVFRHRYGATPSEIRNGS